MSDISKYDPSRKTVGAIYRDAQLSNTDQYVINGDLTKELTKSLVNDLNDAISKTVEMWGNRPFYLTVHESKDLQMPNCIKRRIIRTKYRPWPEDDTIVYWIDPEPNDVRFCWCLPHWAEMDNMLANEDLFEPEMIYQIKRWKDIDLFHFGFCKNAEGNWIENPHYEDKKLEEPKKQKPKILVA